MHRTPWLLANSLPRHRGACTRSKRIYAQRMQIEETVRDLERHRFAFALRNARTKRPERLKALLPIAELAPSILWWLGFAAADRQCALYLLANTERRRPLLSTVFLDQQLWRNHRFKVSLVALCTTLDVSNPSLPRSSVGMKSCEYFGFFCTVRFTSCDEEFIGP